jgi:formamidopyrimidine-DNA glycosylase
MPELPDVEFARRQLEANGLHRKIETADIPADRMRKDVSADRLEQALTGATFGEARRHGKYLAASIERSSGGEVHWLVLHFGMTGRLEFSSDGQPPDNTRLHVVYGDGGQLDFVCPRRFGEIRLVDSFDEFIADKGLGPDAMADDFEREDFVAALKDRRGRLKSALMNQEIIAGIGNVYSDEILYQARIHPDTELADMDEQSIGDLYSVVRRILRTAINHGGDPGGFPSHYLTRARDEGAPCPSCAGQVARTEVSGRGCYYCPACQK